MVKQNPYQYGKPQRSRGGSFQRIENARYVRTRKGWYCVSVQRDNHGQRVDDLAICSVKAVNDFCHAILTGADAQLISIAGEPIAEYVQQHLVAGVGGGREAVPLAYAKTKISIRVRTDLIGSESDENGAYRLLYRNGATKTPALKIYWAKPQH